MTETDETSPGGAAWHAPAQDEPRHATLSKLLAHDSAGDKNVVGVARSIQPRQERKETILNFRVERYDADGNRLKPMPVELRAKKIVGALTDGDWVQVEGKWHEGKTKQVKRVRDITTDTDVGEERHTVRRLVLLLIVAALIVAGLILYHKYR